MQALCKARKSFKRGRNPQRETPDRLYFLLIYQSTTLQARALARSALLALESRTWRAAAFSSSGARPGLRGRPDRLRGACSRETWLPSPEFCSGRPAPNSPQRISALCLPDHNRPDSRDLKR